MLHLSTIGTSTLELLKKLMAIKEFSELRLVGGTALALQLGHRKSIDLDLFGKVEMEKLPVGELFENFSTVEVIQKSRHINIFEIEGVKVDFVNYSYPWLQDEVVMKSLTYFDDADQDMELDMLLDVAWTDVKKYIQKEVVAYTKQ